GEVDVNLTITPIDPPPGFSAPAPLELRIIAPDGNTPPRITGVTGTPNGIELHFSKPMNPAQASNVHNYTVRAIVNSSVDKDPALNRVFWFLDFGPPLGGSRNSRSTPSVPLRAANYDPADFTVTIVPKRSMTLAMENSIVVTPGSAAKTSAHLRHESSPAQALTDLEGNPINQGGRPGEFRIDVRSGYTPLA
ncbi:MAG TPA: hypothetical protein VKA15_21075, partial [Isosphaeraceae bacterium]|nr:hypothetical protein [Isosphaeraceae bacterium]